MLRQAERFSTQTSMKTKKKTKRIHRYNEMKKSTIPGMQHSGSQMLPILQNAMEIFPLPPCRVGWIVLSFKP